MTEVLHFYLQKYGLLEEKVEEKKFDSNEKAKQRWDLLRKSIRSVSALIDKSDLKNNKISHGVHFMRRINNIREIQQASYLNGKDSYLTLDGHSVHLYDSEGKYRQSIPYADIPTSFNRLQWVHVSDRFIAWTPGMKSLVMLDGTFHVIEVVDDSLAADPIFQILYNEDKNEIISTHSNKIITWQFRYANKHIMPNKYIPLNFKDSMATLLDLERTRSKYQRVFIANDCGIIVVCISAGTILSEHGSLHERPITALTFFNPLKLLVTGCKDGSIKVWSPIENEMDLKMVFVGHTASVTALAFFPGGCEATVMSTGNDKTLRVWSLEINDEIECVELGYSSKFIGSEIFKTSFFTVDQSFMDIWQQNHVLEDQATLLSPVTHLEVSLHGPNSAILSCKNNLLLLVSPQRICEPVTKTVISTNQLPEFNIKEKLNILSSVILESAQILFVLVNKNVILQYNTQTNPMNISYKSQCLLEDTLLMLTLYRSENNSDSKIKPKSLLMSGSNKGFIMVHDLVEPGNILFKVEAHSPTAITCLITNPLNSKLFSSGYDKSIKVWRVFPFASEPLTREVSFFCGQLPTHLANIESHLLTVFNDVDGAQYPTVIYDINSRSRYDHSPNDDHVEPVNSVSSSNKMKLFLSNSAGTENCIKIWTCKNVLLRQIEIHFPLNCSAFYTDKADILVSVGNQICKISHESYLPKAYIKKQILMYFKEESLNSQTKVIEFDEKSCEKLFTIKEKEILMGIKEVFKYKNYEDIIPELEEMENLQKHNHINKGLMKVKSVEEDIKMLQSGRCGKSKKKYAKYMEKPKQEDILNAYLSEFTSFYKISLPDDVRNEINENIKKKKSEKFKVCDKNGFFPSNKTINKTEPLPFTITPDGYLPNSSILNKLWPSDYIRENADVWKEPMLSSLDKALARLKALPEVEEDSPKFFDWESEDGKEENENEILESPHSEKDVPSEVSEDVLNRFSFISEEKEFTKEFEIVSPKQDSIKQEIKRPETTKITRESLKLPTISRTPATMPELRKVRFHQASPSQVEGIKEDEMITTVSVETSPEVHPSFFLTQPRNETASKLSILPEFLIPFAEESWFLKICPSPHFDHACLENLPTPLTPTNFCKHLLKIIESKQNIDETVSFVNALKRIYSDDNIEKGTVLSIHYVLGKKVEEIKQIDTDEKLILLKTCLKVMASLEGVSDKAMVVSCLSRYFDADAELKDFLKSLLYHLGMEDNEDVIGNELGNFKLFSVQSGDERISDLQVMVSQWLQKWYQSMVNFASEFRVVIGEEMHLLSINIRKCSKKVLSYLEKVRNIFHLNITNQVDFLQLYPLEKCSKSVLTYINCLNFIRYKVLLKEKKLQVSRRHTIVEENEGPMKTIVSLPKINPEKQCLVRLGESNADIISIVKKKDFSLMNSMWSKKTITDPTQHPAMQPLNHYQIAVGGGFVPYMHLHMKPCLVNPFPRPEDVLEWETVNSKSLFLNAKQSFIHQFSLPPEPF